MGQIKVRKIGNSVGGIFPKEWGLHEGDILEVKKRRKLLHIRCPRSRKKERS